MVPDHWSNDAMVSMDRCGLLLFLAAGPWLPDGLPFFGEDGLINISRGQAGALIKQREAFSLNLLSLETTFNDLYSSRFPLFT